MAQNLGTALSGLSKPGKAVGKPTAKPRGTASMTIEPMPKTSFADKNLDPKMAPGVPGEKVVTPKATAGGTISPLPSAPRQMRTAKASDMSKT